MIQSIIHWIQLSKNIIIQKIAAFWKSYIFSCLTSHPHPHTFNAARYSLSCVYFGVNVEHKT